MRKRGEWMTPMDDLLLETLESSDMVLSPSIISFNLDLSREAVNRRLQTLADHGLVEKIERGKYEITDEGRGYLAGDFDASDV
jgi:predicted transcriptional regulator